MKTFILYQDTNTGELALHVDAHWPDDYPDDSLRFMFIDGNYSCDCNRSRFFARATGRPEPEETICSALENRFRVLAFEVERFGRKYVLAGTWQVEPRPCARCGHHATHGIVGCTYVDADGPCGCQRSLS